MKAFAENELKAQAQAMGLDLSKIDWRKWLSILQILLEALQRQPVMSAPGQHADHTTKSHAALRSAIETAQACCECCECCEATGVVASPAPK